MQKWTVVVKTTEVYIVEAEDEDAAEAMVTEGEVSADEAIEESVEVYERE